LEKLLYLVDLIEFRFREQKPYTVWGLARYRFTICDIRNPYEAAIAKGYF
jgi:hypothetical protein